MDAPLEPSSAVDRSATEDIPATFTGLNPATTAFDVDGVVADTMGLFIDIARDRFAIEHLRYEDMTTYHLDQCLDLDPEIIEAIIRHILDGSYGSVLRPIPGCRRALARFAKRGEVVRFVTARPNQGVIRSWLEATLPLEASQIDVVATGSFEAKTEVLKMHGMRVFVEDRLETCFMLSREGIAPIVFQQPWNRSPHPFREVSSWEEIESLMAP